MNRTQFRGIITKNSKTTSNLTAQHPEPNRSCQSLYGEYSGTQYSSHSVALWLHSVNGTFARYRWHHRDVPLCYHQVTPSANRLKTKAYLARLAIGPYSSSPGRALNCPQWPTARGLVPALLALSPEHTQIVAEWLHFWHDDPLEVGMRGIDQPVIFVGREYGGHQ
jgi:hypothetical protein